VVPNSQVKLCDFKYMLLRSAIRPLFAVPVTFIDFKVGVSLGHGFVSLLVVLDSVPSEE